ncbi:hypothetical protein QT711_18320 [Sporosarcina saromensis]|uniref:DUF3139 domain-containing protein n=1 Tax=Sporosarcina saromensis TaxID=359365 RepID=A0ABU4GDR1_9BACL|nr:hypothetical protein [Sporosarcina saromensis]MDW0115119.1 hypothetical protein [Sporosarcina saromensis]
MKRKYEKVALILILVLLISIPFIYKVVIQPKNALEMYQMVKFAEDFNQVRGHVLEGYEGNVSEELYNEVKNTDLSPEKVRQFTVFEYENETYFIETSPGTMKLKVLGLDKVPEEVHEYLKGLNEEIEVIHE